MVRYRSRARDDIDDIYIGIAQDSSERAERTEQAIRLAGELLGRQPELGVALGHRNVRRWPMTDFRYTIFYVIDWDAEVIDVLRVIDGRRVRDLKRVPR